MCVYIYIYIYIYIKERTPSQDGITHQLVRDLQEELKQLLGNKPLVDSKMPAEHFLSTDSAIA